MTDTPSSWAVVPFKGLFDQRVNQRQASWGKLIETLTTFRVCEDKQTAPLWSPAEYQAGTKRGSQGVRALSCLVLDYDSGVSRIENARRAWGGWPGILHTSWSHTDEHHKFRVIMPLHRPVPVEDWGGVFAWAESWTRTVADPAHEMSLKEYRAAEWIYTVDPACKDPARMFYVPAVSSRDSPAYATHWVDEERPGVFLGCYNPWSRHVKAHRAQQAAIKARRSAPPQRTAYRNPAVSRRAKDSALKTCPHAREALGVELGGKVSADRVGKVTCPQCRRPGVWWIINPTTRVTAQCDHINSCGWYGHLDALRQR